MKETKMKITIITNFREFNYGYSLTSIVVDQITMLARYGHDVTLWVSEGFTGNSDLSEYYPPDSYMEKLMSAVKIKCVVPDTGLIDYTDADHLSEEHFEVAKQFCNLIANELPDSDIVFTHDLIFTGWNLPYARGVYDAARLKSLKSVRWLHWVHSIPSAFRNWWNIKMYGPAHKIVFPNKSNQIHVASQFCGDMEDIKVIPHIKDLRSWFDFDSDTWDFFDTFPKTMDSEIVQVYPASSDRLSSKRVDVLIKMFAYLKRKGKSVCLIIANQHATQRQPKENIEHMIKIGARNGLKRNEDLIFTSDWDKKFENGVPKRILRELMLCSNLFIYPTRDESFGLIGPEAALSGAKMMVFNKSLDMMMEVNGFTGLYCNFGSFEHEFVHPEPDLYYSELANLIIAKMKTDDAVQAATHHRLAHNMDSLYRNYYEPIMQEAKIWAI